MKTLKKIIIEYTWKIAFVFVALMLFIVLWVQLFAEQKRVYDDSMQTLQRINNRLEENEQELAVVQEEYKQTSLHNAEIVAEMIVGNPGILNDLEGLKELAVLLEVDEIHIFDPAGCIFMGTHPEYYGFTFDSGEQMMFFKPMLEDKTLKLVQDITPNTAEGKLMQYSAVWSENGKYIVQVGMEPVNVDKVMEKNKISYIFSTFKINPEADYYDVDATSGVIVGSTNTESIGHSVEEIGMDFDKVKNDPDGFHAVVNGIPIFCIFQERDDTYLGRTVTLGSLYQRIPSLMLILSVCLIFIAFVLVFTVTKNMKKYVVDEIHDINDKLNLIADGKFDENIEVRSSLELSELSDYINAMLKSIWDNNVKMSYVLNKTNLLIGIYEYNDAMSRVRFTEYVPQIFSLNSDQMEGITSNIEHFKNFILTMHENPVPNEPNVYMIGKKYVKFDEFKNDEDIFGVVMDVTADILKRKELETERDIDPMTGLYNRRGLDGRLAELFADPDSLGYYALIMIDSDGLKRVNDTYGHESGDVYLKRIAAVINNFGVKDSVAARQGGDEFVLFLYDYESEEELKNEIKALESIQDQRSFRIDADTRVPLRFSVGYSMAKGKADYQEMLRTADERMYKNKLERKRRNVV